MTTFFGYVNCAAFNRKLEGDTSWYATRAARDTAIVEKRAWAVRNGLSAGAAQAGIYPVKRRVRDGVTIERMTELCNLLY